MISRMGYLLDTHTLLWFLEDDWRLSKLAAATIGNPSNRIFVSDISFFEMAIKIALNKLQIARPLASFIDRTISEDFQILPIRHDHIVTYQHVTLNAMHRDPFDRMLIATALHEGLDIITLDEKFEKYQDVVKIVW